MTALLDRIHLRRHQSAVSFAIATRDGAERHLPAPASDRPRLVATWHAGVDGRLVCAWSASIGAPDVPAA